MIKPDDILLQGRIVGIVLVLLTLCTIVVLPAAAIELEFRPFIDGEYQSVNPMPMSSGQEQRFGLFLTLPNGLAGYNLTVELSEPAATHFKNGSVIFPDWAAFDDVTYLGTLPYTRVSCTATDLYSSTPVNDAFLLFEVTVVANGSDMSVLNINGTSRAIEDREGGFSDPGFYNLGPQKIIISDILPFPRPSGGLFPKPNSLVPASVHQYNDLDGNDVIGFNDVVLYYQYMENIKNEEYGSIKHYDYDENGWIGFNDILKLYNWIQM